MVLQNWDDSDESILHITVPNVSLMEMVKAFATRSSNVGVQCIIGAKMPSSRNLVENQALKIVGTELVQEIICSRMILY